MSRGGDPEFVEQRPAAAMGGREAEEAGPPHRHLPRPLPELGVGAVHDASLRLHDHGGHAALWGEETVT